MPSDQAAVPLPAPLTLVEGESGASAREPLPELVRRAREGDADAFEALYREHAPRLYALCLRLTGHDPDEATALLQDAFVAAWRALPGFRGDAPFGTWMHRLTVNSMLQNVRARRRREARVFAVEDLSAVDIDRRERDHGAHVDLENAIAKLPEGARVVLVLHCIEGYQYQEIAAELGIAVGTVKAQVHRARQLLMRMMEP